MYDLIFLIHIPVYKIIPNGKVYYSDKDMTAVIEAEERYKEELKPVFYTDGYNFFLTLWNLNYAYDKAQNKAQKSQMTDREYILLLVYDGINNNIKYISTAEMGIE